MRFSASLLTLVILAAPAVAQSLPPTQRPGHKMRVKIDSAPQQAAVYVDSKEFGIQGYTPATIKLPKGTYTIILELPGFRPVQKAITISRSEGFVFTMERQARPSVLDVRSSQSNDTATGGSLYVDGAALGTVPARVEVAPGHHLIQVKKQGFKDYNDQADVAEGEQRTMVIELTPEARKGMLLVTADVAGADVFIDGQRRDAAPTLINDLTEGPHTVEVRKGDLPPFKQVVNIVGGQQTKVEALIQAQLPQVGSIRVVSSTPGAEVYIDGEMKGVVNTEIPGIRPGQHIVEVRAKGFAPQSMDVTVAANEQRIARTDLQQQQLQQLAARLRVVTPVPDAEVFIDGSSAGRAPIDRADLAPGKHYVVVRKAGYAEWKREVTLDPNAATTLTAELSASGTVRVLSNVGGADVLIDGMVVGKTPVTVDNVQSGHHLVEVRKERYVTARQDVDVEGGGQKILSADLAPIPTGPSPVEMAQRFRGMTSFSAVTIDPGRFTADVAFGFFPFMQFRLTVGAARRGAFGFDVGVELRTIGYLTDGGVHAKAEFLRAGPFALGATMFIGGGGGPAKRNDFTFEMGVPMTLLFGQLVRFTLHPYLQVYTDRNCPSAGDVAADPSLAPNPNSGWGPSIHCNDAPANGLDPRDRFAGARLMVQGALELSVHPIVTLFFIFEGDAVGQRASYSGKWSPSLLDPDPQIYGRLGATFKF
jgi:PEGA domain